jgi:hypothetical protein
MFREMAVVLKATQEAAAASPFGSYSLAGTLAESQILELHGNPTPTGKVQLPGLSRIKTVDGCLLSLFESHSVKC